jgi:hypothetical protein
VPRHHSILGDALPNWRPSSRLQRTTNPLRRRRPNSGRGSMDDQIPVLSQLLSAAAAATAASLMGDDPNAVRNARGIGGDEGTLESFLESLQNGRISNALSRSDSGSDENGNQSINFVRLFRFGSTPNSNTNSMVGSSDVSGMSSATSGEPDAPPTSETSAFTSADDDENSEGRMVPIIIVGIRSIPPSRTGSSDPDDHTAMPAFLDALTAFDDTPPSDFGDASGPPSGIATPSRFSHHRRRSMGGIGGYDSQRHHQNLQQSRPALTRLPSPMPRRPFSATSEEANLMPAPPGSRPPPSTPASQGLSAFSSGATTPTHTVASSSNFTNSPSNVSSRRPSFVPAAMDPLSNIRAAINGAESGSSTTPSRRARRNRRNSESDFPFGSGSSRRNGMVEPDDGPSNSDGSSRDGSNGSAGSRSWIIYVLGGSYPENHPLLNTPSLFTDSPTYEDMLLLSSMLGPAKPPVATDQEVQAANGIFKIQRAPDGSPAQVVAVAVDGGEIITIGQEERCLVCLTEYETGEEARQLVGCGHLFHQECIDTVCLLPLHSLTLLTVAVADHWA